MESTEDAPRATQLTFKWDAAGPNDVMDPSHKGPVLAYLKKVTDAKSDKGVGPGWY